MKSLSAFEASVLSLLAQDLNGLLSSEDKIRILSKLNGQALKIAQIIVGDNKKSNKKLRAFADEFVKRARSLKY